MLTLEALKVLSTAFRYISSTANMRCCYFLFIYHFSYEFRVRDAGSRFRPSPPRIFASITIHVRRVRPMLTLCDAAHDVSGVSEDIYFAFR